MNCEIGFLPGKSGHADRDGLAAWLKGFEKKPKLVFVNHGEDDSVKDFAEYLSTNFGYETVGPYSGSCYDLLTGQPVKETEGIPIDRKKSPEQTRNQNIFDTLLGSVKSLSSVASGLRTHTNKEIQSLTKDIEKLIKKYTKETDA